MKIIKLLIAISAFLLLPGCDTAGRHGPEDETAVARVGTTVYHRDDLDRFVASRLHELQDLENADRVKSALFESFVEEKLWLYEADRHNVEPDPQILEAMLANLEPDGEIIDGAGWEGSVTQSLEESLKIQRYLKEFILKDVSVSDAECLQHYNQNNEDYVRQEVVHVREILVENPEEARKLQSSLKANRNKKFAELARIYSKSPSASLGGDLGRYERGELPKEFENVIFRLSPGTVSKTLTSEYGYHIFFVEEKILAHHEKFYEVRERIREKLLSERERVIIEDGISLLIKQLPVEIYPEGLDFRYTGEMFAPERGKTQ
jgi:hypothetical protein